MELKTHLFNLVKDWIDKGQIQSKKNLVEQGFSYYELRKDTVDDDLVKSSIKGIFVHKDILETFEQYVRRGHLMSASEYQKSKNVTFHELTKRMAKRQVLVAYLNDKQSLIITD